MQIMFNTAKVGFSSTHQTQDKWASLAKDLSDPMRITKLQVLQSMISGEYLAGPTKTPTKFYTQLLDSKHNVLGSTHIQTGKIIDHFVLDRDQISPVIQTLNQKALAEFPDLQKNGIRTYKGLLHFLVGKNKKVSWTKPTIGRYPDLAGFPGNQYVKTTTQIGQTQLKIELEDSAPPPSAVLFLKVNNIEHQFSFPVGLCKRLGLVLPSAKAAA